MKEFKFEPVVITYVLGVAIDLLASFGVFSLSSTQVAAVMTIATGVVTVANMFLVHEWVVPGIVSAVTTGLVAATAFGLHLSDHQVGVIGSALTIALSLLLRQAVTPVSKPSPAAPVTRLAA